MNKILYGALGAFFISFPMQAKILVYPRIEDRAVVDDGRYKVYVREAGTENAWRELQVFSVEVDMDTRSRAAMAQFDADEPVEVKVVTLGQMADNVKIRPLSQGISYNNWHTDFGTKSSVLHLVRGVQAPGTHVRSDYSQTRHIGGRPSSHKANLIPQSKRQDTTIIVIPCLCSFTVPSSPFSEPPANKKRTRTLSHRELGSSTNCMVEN